MINQSCKILKSTTSKLIKVVFPLTPCRICPCVYFQCNPQLTRRKYRLYSPTAMTNAYKAVKEGNMPVLRASKQFGVPENSLRDRVLGKVPPETVTMGREPLFSNFEEATIVEHVKKMANYGYGYTRHELSDIASDYAFQLGKRAKDNPVTIKWVIGFLGRWPELRVLKPRSLEQIRAKMTSETVVSNYFEELEHTIVKYGLTDKPHMIFNVDEKGISQDHTPPQVISGTLVHPPAVTSGKSSTVTILGCGSASGMAVPPYFVFPGKRMISDLLQGATPGADGCVSDSGWSNSEVFRNYLEHHFMKFVPTHSDQKILLLLDGHKSHVSVGLVEWANSQGIILYILPAHTSHLLQPMDVACYGPFQRIYNSLCHQFMRETSGTITRYNVCELACKAYTRALSAENLQSAFRRTGIFPLNKDAIPKEYLIPAEVFVPENMVTNEDENDSDATIEGGVVVESENSEPSVNKKINTVNFFQDKETELKRVKTETSKKPRKTMSKIVSGHAITENRIESLMRNHEKEQNKTKTARKVSKKEKVQSKRLKEVTLKPKSKESKKLSKKVTQTKVPSAAEPQPGPSCIAVDSDSDMSVDSDTPLDKLCCVCQRNTPKELRHCTSIVFPKWAQCDGFKSNGMPCLHWTHLVYCSKVRVLRLHDKFYCPHCVSSYEE